MGEAIISRAGGGGGSKENIPSDISIMLLTLTDSAGKPANAIPVQCNDAGILYNYATNSNGQVLFTSLKSGWANLNISTTYVNGVIIADQVSNGWYNIEAPFGKNTKANLALENIKSKSITNGNYVFIVKDSININMAGGGGGDGGSFIAYRNNSDRWTRHAGGSGGGGAQIQEKVTVQNNTIYQAIIGVKGSSGRGGYVDFRDDNQNEFHLKLGYYQLFQ